jgi:hypothetical protein
MTTEQIIDNKIKEMMIKYPDWERPTTKEVYVFSIDQVEEMFKELLEEVEKMIDEYCSNKYGKTDMKLFDLEVRKELKQKLRELKEKK